MASPTKQTWIIRDRKSDKRQAKKTKRTAKQSKEFTKKLKSLGI